MKKNMYKKANLNKIKIKWKHLHLIVKKIRAVLVVHLMMKIVVKVKDDIAIFNRALSQQEINALNKYLLIMLK